VNHYHRLAPFLDFFQTGVPLLTYHKIGPSPRGARIKGLYIGSRLFSAQLRELSRAGFSTPRLHESLRSATPGRRIVLTFDDGFRNVFELGLPLLRSAGLRAMVYLLPPLLGRRNEWDLPHGEKPEPLMDEHQVRDWLLAGNEIGSHTLSHPYLTRLPAARAKIEIADSKKALEDRFGIPIHDFCYPYGDYNEPVRGWVAEAGYLTACTIRWGINLPHTPPLELHRIAVRYPTRRVRSVYQRVRGWLKKSLKSP
jgi:peptidoglycan/xylan/chitin deacetylase (PgdA/CDA1 family)